MDMDKFDEMSTSEYKKYEKSILSSPVAEKTEIDFILESDPNFVICYDGTKKINPESEFREYLKVLYKQIDRKKLKESFKLLK